MAGGDDELVLYTHPMSRGRIARWALEEVGRPYRAELMDFERAMKGPAYRAINPMAKVPALRHGATVVTEGAAICAYLADAFPDAGLAPAPGSAARGPYYRWLFFAAGPLEMAVTDRAMGRAMPADKARMSGYGDYDATLDALEAALAGEASDNGCLAGGRFSAADLYVCAHLSWGMMFGTVERRPRFAAYVAGLEARPAFVRAKATDDALMPAPAA